MYVSEAKTAAVSCEKTETEGGYHGVRECLWAQQRMQGGETLSSLATFLAGR